MIAFAIAATYFAVIGVAMRRLLHARPRGRLTAVGEAILYGIGTTGAAGYLAGVLNVPLTRTLFVGLWFGALAVLLRRRTAKRTPLARLDSLTCVFLTLASVPVIVTIVDSATMPLTDYDGRVTWMLKARAIAAEESISGPFFRGETSRNAHSQYPLLLPIADAALLKIGETLDDHAARPVYALAAAALLMMIWSAACEVAPPAASAVIVASVAWLPQLASEPDGGMLSAYSDVPLAAFVALLLYSVVAGRATEEPASFGVQLAFVILTKNEGVVFAAVLLIAATAWSDRTQRKRLAISLVAAAVAFALLALWRTRVPLEFDENYPHLLVRITRQLGRYPEAAKALFSRMAGFRRWGAFWIVSLLATCAALGSSVRRRRAATIACCVAVNLLVDVTMYAITSWNIDELAVSSADRLLLQVVPYCALLIAMGAATLFRREPAQR